MSYLFFLFSSGTLFLNLIYYIFRRRGFRFKKIKILLYLSLIITISFLIGEFDINILGDSSIILENFEYYLNYLLFYNISIIFCLLSIIFHIFGSLNKNMPILCWLQRRKITEHSAVRSRLACQFFDFLSIKFRHGRLFPNCFSIRNIPSRLSSFLALS